MNVLYEVSDGVATVTLNRPAVLNAVDRATEDDLEQVWRSIEADVRVRVVVLTGAGERAFCAGADLKGPATSGLEYWASRNAAGFGGIAMRDTLSVPVVGRVNGLALGGGFEMVLGCDLVIACEEASFGLPEALVGRTPLDGGMILLQRQIPHRLAMEMLLTGSRISAVKAHAIGLINEVASRAELDKTVELYVQSLLRAAPLSQRAIKQVVRHTASMPANQARALAPPELMEALLSEDAGEGPRAFREKRAPVWKGR